MKTQFSFIKLLFLITVVISCQRNISEDVKIDKVITFAYECDESISKDIDSVIYFPLESNPMALFSNSSKVVFRNNKVFIGDFFCIKLLFMIMQENSYML